MTNAVGAGRYPLTHSNKSQIVTACGLAGREGGLLKIGTLGKKLVGANRSGPLLQFNRMDRAIGAAGRDNVNLLA